MTYEMPSNRNIITALCTILLQMSFFTSKALLPGAQLPPTDEPCSCDFKKDTKTLTVACSSPSFKSYKRCFENYKNAKNLFFINSSLETIPMGLTILNELTELDLSYNLLTSLNFTGSENVCKNLKLLNLEFNQIIILKKGMLDCFISLEQIFLRNNSMEKIENGAFSSKLKTLYNVQLIYNKLKNVDMSLIYLPKLKQNTKIRVNVSWNNIGYLTNSIGVTMLNFTPNDSFILAGIHNNVTIINTTYYFHLLNITLPAQLYRFWNSGFDIRFNPFICDCDMYYLAKELRNFTKMDPNNPLFSIACYEPLSLRGMMVYAVQDKDFNCSVTNNCPRDCICTETIALNLTSVRCDNNYIENYLPVSVPSAENLQLIIESGSLQQLSRRDYMSNLFLLDVSNSGVNSVITDILPQLDEIESVFLHDNALRALPHEINELKFKKLSTLTLHGNPFDCDCHTLWLKKWLLTETTSEHVPHQDKIICGSGVPKGKILVQVPDSDFKCIYSLTQGEVIAIIVSSALVLLFIVIIIYFARSHIHLYILAYISPTLFRKRTNRHWLFDIFASYSSIDDAIIKPIIDKLKAHNPPYKVQIDTNFSVGRPIADAIITSIESSHTTLLFLSNNFLRSKWCKLEFREAHLRFIRDRKINLILIVLEELDPNLLDKKLNEHMKWHSYLKNSDPYFWQKLLKSIPVRCISSEKTPLISSASP